jgi:tight adherence protein C
VILVLFIGLLFVAVAFGLFARTLLFPRMRAAEALRQIDVYGFNSGREPAAPTGLRARVPTLDELVNAIAGSFGNVLSKRIKSASEENLGRLLRSAGYYSVPPRRFLGYQMLSTLVLGGVFLLLNVAGNASAISILLVIVGFLGGWTLPIYYLRRRARSRNVRVDCDMPDLIDMLVATVEAGIAFSAALQIAGRRFRGPLGEELRLTLQEQNMGLGLNAALDNMLQRQNTRGMRAFVRSLVQGEQLGIAVGQTLRNLSHDMRTLRRQLAEERAQKAPVKLVFPVVLLIFPAMLVVTLGPAFLQIKSIFSS